MNLFRSCLWRDVCGAVCGKMSVERCLWRDVCGAVCGEMSVEDESVQEEEDPFAEERKEVLHELEVVGNEKDAKHALMENLKMQIRQLEVRHVSQQKLVWSEFKIRNMTEIALTHHLI